MSKSLRDSLKKARDKKTFTEQGNDSYSFNELIPVDNLPKDKPIEHVKGKCDQCFILVPDVHSYQRDVPAFDLFMKALPILNKSYNVTKFVQLGDLLECGEFSSHPITSVYERIPNYIEEVDWALNHFWKPAMDELTNANFYALIGNHEDRINKWLGHRLGSNPLATQIYNDYMPMDLYKGMGIHVTPHGREDVREGILELFPNLYCIHGWSIAKNAAKAHIDIITGAHSIVFGHTHRAQSDIRRNPVSNEYIRSSSFGSLAKTAMLWHNGKPTDHTLGFGVVFTYGKHFVVQHIPITMDGNKRIMILPNGEVLEG